MHEATRGITYTPTFAVYRGGRKVGAPGAAGRAGATPPCALLYAKP